MPDFNTNLINRISSRQAIPAKEFFVEKDLPAAIANIISLADNTVYEIKDAITLTAGNRIKYGANSRITGIGDTFTSLTGNTTDPLILGDGTNAPKAENIGFIQTGTGDLWDLTMAAGGVAIFDRCSFNGGDFRCVSGRAILIFLSEFIGGARLVQDGTGGGVGAIRISANSLILDSGIAVSGLIDFEAGSATDFFTYNTNAIVLVNGSSIGVRVASGATIENVTINGSGFNLIGSGSVGVQVANPDDISVGSIEGSNIVDGSAGTLLSCEPTEFTNIDVTGTLSGTPGDLAVDNDGNMIVSDPLPIAGNPMIYRFTGRSSTFLDSLIPPNTNVDAVTWFEGDLYSANEITNVVYKHVGFTTTTLPLTITGLGTGLILSMTFAGQDMLLGISDSIGGSYFVNRYDGFSDTLIDTIPAPDVGITGVAFDGLNLSIVSGSPSKVYVMLGVSDTVQYFFSTGVIAAAGMDIYPNASTQIQNFIFSSDTDNRVRNYEQALTFDNSARTWEISDLPGVRASSDRGGTRIDPDTAFPVTPSATEVWEGIEDDSASVFWRQVQASEKSMMRSEVDGSVWWTGTRVRGRTITGTMTYGTGENTERFYKVSIFINGELMRDSINTGAVPTNKDVPTLATVPIKADLDHGDFIEMKWLARTDTHLINVALAAIQIT